MKISIDIRMQEYTQTLIELNIISTTISSELITTLR
jgi:hypothetical protein